LLKTGTFHLALTPYKFGSVCSIQPKW